MTTTAKKSWLALLATGGMLITSSLVALPAKATPCVNGLLISTIVAEGSAGYSCNLGSITYTFNEDISELGVDQFGAPNPLASISFTNSLNQQRLSFDNLLVQGYVFFNYEILSPIEAIESVAQIYTPSNMSPPPGPTTGVTTTPLLPSPPSSFPVIVTTIFEPGNPPTTLNSLTHNIEKTPGPLPIAGASLAFAFSRTLRRRIHQVSPKRLPA